MSTTDNARLDALDRRGQAAGRTLLDDLAARGARTLVADDPPTAAGTDPAAPDGAADPAVPFRAGDTGPAPADSPGSTEPAPSPATEPPALP
jgi:hypothetical protein